MFQDLQSLPRNAALRKLNDLIKRARLAKVEGRYLGEKIIILVCQVHAYIISSLKKDMPSVFGKEGKKKELIKNLDALYTQLQREHQISPGDFPDIKKMQEQLANQDFTKFHQLDRKLLERVDKMLAEDIAKMMSMIPLDEENRRQNDQDKIKGGAFDGVMETATPFMFKGGEGINAGVGEQEWVVSKERSVSMHSSSRQGGLSLLFSGTNTTTFSTLSGPLTGRFLVLQLRVSELSSGNKYCPDDTIFTR